MAPRWEYLNLRWYSQRANPPDPNVESAEWTIKNIIEIRWPGSEKAEVVATEIVVWRNGMSEWEQTQKPPTDLFGFLNRLGAEGWECYSTQVMASGVGPRDGYEAGSHPLDVRYLLKRQRGA